MPSKGNNRLRIHAASMHCVAIQHCPPNKRIIFQHLRCLASTLPSCLPGPAGPFWGCSKSELRRLPPQARRWQSHRPGTPRRSPPRRFPLELPPRLGPGMLCDRTDHTSCRQTHRIIPMEPISHQSPSSAHESHICIIFCTKTKPIHVCLFTQAPSELPAKHIEVDGVAHLVNKNRLPCLLRQGGHPGRGDHCALPINVRESKPEKKGTHELRRIQAQQLHKA